MRGLAVALACLLIPFVPAADAGYLAREGGAVVFTFDDGCASDLTAASMLEARGFRGTFFIPSGLDACSSALGQKDVVSLSKRGHDIESHSITHPDLRTLSDEMVLRELAVSQMTLRNWTGQTVRHFAYPYASFDARIIALTARYYDSARAYDQSFALMPLDTDSPHEIPAFGVTRTTTAAAAIENIDSAVSKGAELVLTFHSIRSDPRAYDTTPTILGQILDHVKAKGYTVLTYREALASYSPSPPPSPSPTAPALGFTPKGGNEWWVQVAISGADAGAVARVEAHDTGGAWVTLVKKSWGDYAASFHVEPGHLVTYRATLTDGRSLTSCDYVHPGGTCSTGSSSPPPPTSTTFAATFKNVRGNTWWIETDVTVSGGTLAGVDGRVNGGSWIALTKQSWGSWAKSINAPTGSHVEFRARATDGATAISSSYAWPP